MSADLMDERRCRATSKQSGKQCRRFPAPGGSVCVIHGGASPQARAAAERRRAEAEATVLLGNIWDPDAAPVSDPVEALASLAGKTQHAVDVLGAMVTTGQLDGPAGIAWSKTIRELRQMLEGLERLGLDDRRVKISEQTGALFSSAVRAILDRLGLTADQQVLALTVVPEEFRALATRQVVAGEVVEP